MADTKEQIREPLLQKEKQPGNSSPRVSVSMTELVLLVNILEIVFVAMQSIAKVCTQDKEVSVMEFCLVRCFFNFIFQASIICYQRLGLLSGVQDGQGRMLIYRSIVCAFAMNTVIATVKLLPLTIAMVILNTSPFFVALLTYFWLRTRITCFEVVAMFLSYAGVVIIAISQKESSSELGGDQEIVRDDGNFVLGLVIASVAAVTVALVQVLTNKLKNVPTAIITFHMSVAAGIMCSCYLLYNLIKTGDWPLVGYPREVYLLFFAAGLLEGAAQNMFSYVNQVGNPFTVSLLLYVSIIYAFLADTLIFKLDLNALQLAGVGLMLTCNISVIVYKLRTSQQSIKLENESKQTPRDNHEL